MFLKACIIVLATNAPNPEAIYWHEMAHCWGWHHPVYHGTRDINYQAPKPPFWYSILGNRPNTTVYYDTMSKVRSMCGKNEPFGCMWK